MRPASVRIGGATRKKERERKRACVCVRVRVFGMPGAAVGVWRRVRVVFLGS